MTRTMPNEENDLTSNEKLIWAAAYAKGYVDGDARTGMYAAWRAVMALRDWLADHPENTALQVVMARHMVR